MSKYTLYGAEVSYYTGKARAYLRWRGAPFEEVNATGEIYRDVIMPNIGWPVIPVLKAPDGSFVQDTGDIIAHVEAAGDFEKSVYPEGEVQKFVSELIHLYADEWLVLPAMHYRWSFNEDWAYGEFGEMSAPHLSPQEQYQLGAKNGARFKGALPVLGVHDETIPGIEVSYLAFLDDFSAHLEVHDYVFGARPTLADFALIGPLYAHLWRDPESRILMETRAPRVVEWVHRVNSGAQGEGEVVAGDEIPQTLLALLSRQMREQFPALKQTLALFEEWTKDAEAEARLPRGLGEIKVSVEGHEGPAVARSFPLYRLQAVHDAYGALGAEARVKADTLLEKIGGDIFQETRLPARLTRRDYRLALA